MLSSQPLIYLQIVSSPFIIHSLSKHTRRNLDSLPTQVIVVITKKGGDTPAWQTFLESDVCIIDLITLKVGKLLQHVDWDIKIEQIGVLLCTC